MKMQVFKLENECQEMLDKAMQDVSLFEASSLEKLNKKQSAESWSALECLDHLIQYAAFYLPEIQKQIEKSTFKPAAEFKAGILGNYFVNSMRVNNGAVKKMKAPKDKTPAKSVFDLQTIEKFKNDLLKIQELLEKSAAVDLTKTKTAISLTPMIKLRLGDTFRFYIVHIARHLWQAKNALEKSKK